MKSSKVFNPQAQDVRQHLNEAYEWNSSGALKIKRDLKEFTYRKHHTNVGCQCNISGGLICTCRTVTSREPRYFSFPKQVYRYSGWRSHRDVRVGIIKTVPRRRIKKIYLPETIDRGVGSSDLILHVNCETRQKWAKTYYKHRRTSSKCVGEYAEDLSILNKNSSVIIRNKSCRTNRETRKQEMNTASYDLPKNKISPRAQITCTNDLNKKTRSSKNNGNHNTNNSLLDNVTTELLQPVANNCKYDTIKHNNKTCEDYSSDSLVQYFHNLEIPSDKKQSKTSLDSKESKLENSKIFATKSKERLNVDKSSRELKSESVLKRRFEALRRGLGKNEYKKESVSKNKMNSQTMYSRKNVSIERDAPCLKGRSHSNTKIFTPLQLTRAYKVNSKVLNKKNAKSKEKNIKDGQIKNNSQWSPELVNKESKSSQGAFKLQGKECNLDADNYKTSTTISAKSPDIVSKSESPLQEEIPKRKQGRKFFLFGKKTKEKDNKPYKPKKGVTAKRGKINDEVSIKLDDAKEYIKKQPVKHLEKMDIKRKDWVDKFITNTKDSRNSVHIRWNNKMYATSSSTILEIMDSMYKDTRTRSKSEIETEKSSYYRSYTKQRVYFMKQDIAAWMIPELFAHKPPKRITDERFYHSCNKCHRWFVDSSKGISQKIEVVLHSKPKCKSSEYVIINLPDDYLSNSSCELRSLSSEEKIYKIIEYDTSELKKVKENRPVATVDNFTNNKNVTISVQIDKVRAAKRPEITETVMKKQPLIRDVATQGSDVYVPKRCDVIGVGIITQRDIADARKPVLKIEDEFTDDDSVENLPIQDKKCELAESYFQDYCKSWMPSGIDILSLPISDTQFHSSKNNSVASFNQGDGTKSYQSMYEVYKESTVAVTSCETSSCNQSPDKEGKNHTGSNKSIFFWKFKKKNSEAEKISDIENCPKDSLKVYRRRQYYACTNQRSMWFNDDNETHSMPKPDCSNKPCWKSPDDNKNKKRVKKKRVLFPGCSGKIIDKLSEKMLEGILSFKGSEQKGKGLKHASLSSSPVCEIPQPSCKESCEKQKKPPCTKKNAPSSDDLYETKLDPNVPVPPCMMKPPLCTKSVKKRPPCSACVNLRRESNENSTKNLDCKKTSDECRINAGAKSSSDSSCLTCQNDLNSHQSKKITHTAKDCRSGSKELLTGLHLKKLPSKKKIKLCKECFANVSSVETKNDISSTEDIRESLNIKVKDEDGQTLYERIDYKKKSDVSHHLLQDVHKYPQIQRVSTPTTVQDMIAQSMYQNESHETKSDTSINNLIEINLKLKLKPDDKGTEVNIRNEGEAEIKHENAGQIKESQDIYIIQNQTETDSVITGNKNDVSIKIVIMNHQTDSVKNNETAYAMHNAVEDIFNTRISEKIHTVSTGYSDINQKAYSYHRATSDLTRSDEKCDHQNKLFERASCIQLLNDPNKLLTSSQSVTERSVTKETVKYNKCRKDISTARNHKSSINNVWNSADISQVETDTFKYDKPYKYTNLKSKNRTVDEISNENVLYKEIRLSTKTDKKEMLCGNSSAVKNPENQKKFEEIIHEILTTDSSGTEIAVTSNELAKELTYTSLDPVYFRVTDNTDNYDKFDNSLSNLEKTKGQRLNPTKGNSKFTENDSAKSFVYAKEQGCSTLEAKLNITELNIGENSCCYCTEIDKKDKEINCHLGIGDFPLSPKTCIDVVSQTSKHVLNKMISANLRNNPYPVAIANTSVTIQKNHNKHEHLTAKHKSSKTIQPDWNNIMHFGIKSKDREKLLRLSGDEMIVFNTVEKFHNNSGKIFNRKDCKRAVADILQLNETKRAVLEIYTERFISDEGEKVVAKLPKYHIEKENYICNYEEIVTGLKKGNKKFHHEV